MARIGQDKNGENIISQTLYNAKQKLRLESLSGFTSSQNLLETLNVSQWTVDYVLDESNRLNALFLAHEESVELGKKFNTSFVMDCTYQTNRYQLKVLCVMESNTCFNTSFYLCIAFIPKETEEWHEWALRNTLLLFQGRTVPKTLPEEVSCSSIVSQKSI